MITADYELVPEDELNCRGAMIEAFRLRGIHPDGAISLAEESLLWENVEGRLPPLGGDALPLLHQVFFHAVRSFDLGWAPPTYQPGADPTAQSTRTEDGEEVELDVNADFAQALHRYATANALNLGLDPGRTIQVRGFHTVFRVAPNGRLLVEVVAQFAQMDRSVQADLGGLPFRGGCTLVASSNGAVRYLISKPMPKPGAERRPGDRGALRLRRQEEYVQLCDARNPLNSLAAYAAGAGHSQRMLELMDFAALHGTG
jgi:hypothetical protein